MQAAAVILVEIRLACQRVVDRTIPLEKRPDRFVSRLAGALLSSFSIGQINLVVGLSDEEATAENHRRLTNLLTLMGCDPEGR